MKKKPKRSAVDAAVGAWAAFEAMQGKETKTFQPVYLENTETQKGSS